ncbi:CHASE domain-containing protein [Glaciimonas immobilis]|uniref:Uncharacterized protein n=1 Tax=Glaciimonas immobilis TaxID=728004 RepID=A0A840RRB2_9BURK|nr:CHASE domain-containing protein [Glaciimonas immobilis]KAF3997846.1 hypothetical protein HAV38_09640 [Glaciimonas immobilis]MBB5199516.1 hypothetical protein [Glaciimonas immobilis]
MFRRLPISLTLSARFVLVFGIFTSTLLFLVVCQQERGVERHNFERHAQLRIAVVEPGTSDAVKALRVVNQLFVMNRAVAPEQSHVFTQPLRERHPFIERPPFEARIHFDTGSITIDGSLPVKHMPAGVKKNYRVLEHIEPMRSIEGVFIFNAASLLYQNAAVQHAEDTGLQSATTLFHFLKKALNRAGFIS